MHGQVAQIGQQRRDARPDLLLALRQRLQPRQAGAPGLRALALRALLPLARRCRLQLSERPAGRRRCRCDLRPAHLAQPPQLDANLGLAPRHTQQGSISTHSSLLLLARPCDMLKVPL